jgi:hypothetical protein
MSNEGKRVIQNKSYPFFYNPLWSYLGDAYSENAGTYYYDRAEDTCYFWNAFDQALISPSLLRQWQPEHFKVITKVSNQRLLTPSGYPSTKFSDHLPILLRLEI